MERGPSDPRESRFDGLHAEAKAALAYSANSLKAVRERYREAYADELARWHDLRDELGGTDGTAPIDGAPPADAMEAAEAGAEDARVREIRRSIDRLTSELGLHQQDLAKLDIAARTLESVWVFLERGDASLMPGASGASLPTDEKMRLLEAQEEERQRIAQEIHDGPAQGIANAVFQAEYIERVLDSDPRLARSELRYLREVLRRELGDVRSMIGSLRPPLLDDLGLDGALTDAVETARAVTGVPIELELGARNGTLSAAQATVALRVTQEALANIRKHAEASRAWVRTSVDDDMWALEIGDDGRGFDPDTVAVRGRRNFGLQFMHERADLVGARFEVRSRPSAGTVVWLAIPTGGEEVG